METKTYLEMYQKDWETGSQNAGFVEETKKRLLSIEVKAAVPGENSILLESSENFKSYFLQG